MICGQAFTPHLGGKSVDQRACGRACGAELHRRSRGPSLRRIPQREVAFFEIYRCAGCDRPQVGSSPRACSSACAADAKRRYDREYNTTVRMRSDWDRSPRACKHCNSSFAPTYVGQEYHDRACGERAKRKRERKTGVRHNGDLHRRRARKYGRRYVPIKPADIFERDRWICQICKKRVSRVKKAPHPAFAEPRSHHPDELRGRRPCPRERPTRPLPLQLGQGRQGRDSPTQAHRLAPSRRPSPVATCEHPWSRSATASQRRRTTSSGPATSESATANAAWPTSGRWSR